VAAKRKFTRIPKVQDLILAGVPTEVIPTYCALSDYTNNKTGLCWPKMETLAATLGRSARTIQRHLHQLRELGLVEFVERRQRVRTVRLCRAARATLRREPRDRLQRLCAREAEPLGDHPERGDPAGRGERGPGQAGR